MGSPAKMSMQVEDLQPSPFKEIFKEFMILHL